MSKEIKATYLVRLSGDTNSTMMFRIDSADRERVIDYAQSMLNSMPYDMAEVWHFETLKLVATFVKRSNTDLK